MKAGICTQNIQELKSFATPPQEVVSVISAAYILLVQDKVPTWAECKKMLLNTNQLLRMVKEYDTSKVTPSMKDKVRVYVEEPYFNKAFVMKVSSSCAPLCEWVLEVYYAC